MQIHELNSFVGTPSETDYLAIDDGTETNKVPATSLGVSTQMTQAEAEAGTVTDPRVVSPSVFKTSVESIAETIAETVMKKSLEIRTITVQGTTNSQGALSIQGTSGVSADDEVLSVACTNGANIMCIPWKYDNKIWYAKCLDWGNMTSRNDTSVTVVVKYIPNGYL